MKDTKNNEIVHGDYHMRGTPTEDITWSNIDLNPGEAAARGTQIKIMLGLKDGSPITPEQLKYVKDNYLRLTGADNNLQAFLDSITDFYSAAGWLSRESYSITAALNLLDFDFLKHPFGIMGF
jgi:hypothetical protein